MIFVLDEAQESLRDTARGFFTRHSTEADVRKAMDTDAGFDRALWRRMAVELGLPGLVIPEEHGGSGYYIVELGLVMEEMGRALVCAPYLSTAVLGAHAVLFAGSDEDKARYLPPIADGTSTATLAWVEDSGRWDPRAVDMRARQCEDGGWTLTGTKTFVLDGHTADLVVVAARTEDGLTLFAVDGSAEGLIRTPLPTLDPTRKLARLDFADTPAAVLGEPGTGVRVLERVLDVAALALAAEQTGGARRCLEMAVGYAKERVQFGRLIGSFQAIKHKCADMLLRVESATSAAHYGLGLLAENSSDVGAAAALAKAYCSEAYFEVAADNIQIHGGIGFTWEHPAHLYFRRAKSSELLFGDPTYQRAKLADRLCPIAA